MVDVARIQAVMTRSPRAEVVTGGPDRAAVAMILRDGAAGAEVLLIRRAEREGDPWSGHIGLPGGRWELGDTSLAATAMRETNEEVGLDLTIFGIELGTLPTITAVARGFREQLTITPYLFAITGDPMLHPNEEVDQTLWVPLLALLDPGTSASVDYELDGARRRLPAWNVRGQTVWGLTHAMLSSLLAMLR